MGTCASSKLLSLIPPLDTRFHGYDGGCANVSENNNDGRARCGVYNGETMVSYPHIESYRSALEELIEFGGSDGELSIRAAFQNCLAAYCREHRERLALVPELRAANNVVPDGTVKDALRMARGYWEAKDSHDDLDAEIQRKFNSGYPRGNILFEDSQTAVLIQNREEAMRADMSRPGELHRLIRRFLDYELPQIEEFRQAQRTVQDRPAYGHKQPAGGGGTGGDGQRGVPGGSDRVPGAVQAEHRAGGFGGGRSGDAAPAHSDEGHIPAGIR